MSKAPGIYTHNGITYNAKRANPSRADTTKIIIAQRISSIENSDRIIVLDNGEVVGFDTPQNLLMNNQIYRENYEFQKQGGGFGDE